MGSSDVTQCQVCGGLISRNSFWSGNPPLLYKETSHALLLSDSESGLHLSSPTSLFSKHIYFSRVGESLKQLGGEGASALVVVMGLAHQDLQHGGLLSSVNPNRRQGSRSPSFLPQL